jgi:hypothetical protein
VASSPDDVICQSDWPRCGGVFFAWARLNEPIEQHARDPFAVSCRLCDHDAVISAGPWPDDLPVPVFGPRVVCDEMRDRWCRRAAELAGASSARGVSLLAAPL